MLRLKLKEREREKSKVGLLRKKEGERSERIAKVGLFERMRVKKRRIKWDCLNRERKREISTECN